MKRHAILTLTCLVPCTGVTLVVFVFDSRSALAAGAVITSAILVMDTIFSIIITYIFLKVWTFVSRSAF